MLQEYFEILPVIRQFNYERPTQFILYLNSCSGNANQLQTKMLRAIIITSANFIEHQSLTCHIASAQILMEKQFCFQKLE